MVILIDIACTVMILAGALFLGSVALSLIKEASKSDKKDE
jgi:hypothetical protein